MNDLTILLAEYRKRGNLLKPLTNIKENLSANEFVKLANNPSLAKLNEEIWGKNIFPQKWDLDNKPFATFFSGNLIPELKYLIASCIAYKDQLIKYEMLKNRYECLVLDGDFKKAHKILNEVENNFGESLWLINSKFFIVEKTGGTEENWKLLADLSRDRNDSLVRLLIENKSRLNETKVRYTDYLKTTRNRIRNFPVGKQMRSFLSFESNIDFPRSKEAVAVCTYIYSFMPIIDRYNAFNSLLKLFYCNMQEEEFKEIGYQVRHFHKAFPTNVIARNILILAGHKNLEDSHIDYDYLELLDNIYKGNGIKGEDFISKRFPDKFSFKHYIDLHAYFNEGVNYFPEKTLHREISELIKKINSKNSDFEENVLDLKKMSVQFSTFDNVTYLDHYIDKENSLEDSYISNDLRMIISEPLLPIDSILGINSKNVDKLRDTVFERIKLKYPDLNTILIAIHTDNYSELFVIKDRCIELEAFYGRSLAKTNQHEAAIDSFKRTMNSSSGYYRSFAILDLIASCLAINNYKELVSLIGNTIVSTPYLLYRMELDGICEILGEIDDPTIKGSIFTPIIFAYASSDMHDRYMALDDYLISLDLEKPSDLVSKINPEDESILIHLLEKACIIDVLKYFTAFSGIKEVELERLEILKYLSGKDAEIRESIVSEIIELSQKDIIRRGLSSYNRGKFSLNAFQFRKYLVESISQSYNRLKLQAEFSNDSDFKTLDYENEDDVKVEIDLQSLGKINTLVSLKDPAFISFKSLYNEIRDLFLFSKEYGLDGVLSTRIRHGILTNHIKKVFLSLNIMSTKESDQYQDIKHWGKVLSISTDKMDELQNELKKFSQIIDNYCNILRLDFIQIKTEKDSDKPNALFDFSIPKDFYLKAFALIQDNNLSLTDFVNFTHATLIATTKWQLDKIREILINKVNSDLRINLDALRAALQAIFIEQSVPELFISVNQASTNITHELSLISSWFNISEEDDNLLLTQTEIIQVAIRLSNILHPYYFLDPVITDSDPIKIGYSSGFIDLLKILLDNIIIHSKCVPDKLDLQITSKLNNSLKMLSIKLEHNLGISVDIPDLERTLLHCKDNWNSLDFYGDRISREGGSGLRKINRILQYELEIPNNYFDFTIIQNRLAIEIGLELTYLNEQDTYT